MKKFNLLFLFPLLITSCTTYQILTVKSTDAQQKIAGAPFIFDNDSVHIEYSFMGQNGALNIKIQNKLDKPIVVDWNRSALILNGQAVSMANKNLPINGNAVTETQPDYSAIIPHSKTSYSNINLNGVLPQNMDFIPPHSFIVKQPVFVLNKVLPNINPNSLEKITPTYSPANIDKEPLVKKADYTANSSPLKLNTYLTFLTKDSLNNAKTFAYEQNFYVSQLYVSNIDPQEVNLIDATSADRFFVY